MKAVPTEIVIEKVSVADLAEMMGVATRSIYRGIERGDIPQPIKLGGWWWTRAIIRDWLQHGKGIRHIVRSDPNYAHLIGSEERMPAPRPEMEGGE